jgi:DNA polymerase I-like protein with 3'-5' exonuclease and polymerase domains
MRDDALGFFWEDLQTRAGRSVYARPIPPIPENGWVAPTEFPRLAECRVLGLDTETKDTALTTKGPGFRRDGDDGAHIVGIAVGTPEGDRWYFPMRHTIAPEQNLDPGHVLAWARDNLCTPGQTKVGANLMYDVDALWSEGVPVTGPFIDVQFAEALLDENRFTYNLQALMRDYMGTGKVKDALQEWLIRAYGDVDTYRANIWRAPPCLVGPYAQGDVDGPLLVWEKQKALLAEQDLSSLFDLETSLIEPLVHMRQRGVRVDVEYAKRLDDELTAAIDLIDARIAGVAGRPISTTAKGDLERLFKAAGVEFPRTPTGQPSFAKEFLERCSHPVAQLIVERRKLAKYRDTFVRGYVLDLHVNGRLHALFHPLKGDDNGTVSGRFSSSLPNLQNIPVRDPVWGPKLRALFLPEDGELWGRHDWSQIEYRFLAHYARGPSGNIVRQQYNEDPNTDFHEMTLGMVAPVAGWDISTPELHKQHRKPIKNINFGLTYGMGQTKLANDLGLSKDDGSELFRTYHTAVPFVKKTYDSVSEMARDRGWIKTVLGRRARFELWEPRFKSDDEKKNKALPYDRAIDAYNGRVVRAFTHKALNRLLQGSAADLMKVAMSAMWKTGIHRTLGHMLLTCHDETGHSTPQTAEGAEALNEVKHIMDTCLKLRVPVIAEQSTGINWGACV